jgi:hypothetical protein
MPKAYLKIGIFSYYTAVAHYLGDNIKLDAIAAPG